MRGVDGLRRDRWLPSLLLAGVLPAACADVPDDATDTSAASDTSEPPSRWPLPRTCTPPAGLGRPTTIDGVVDLVNALPKPTSLPCLLESLDRPLSLYASTSTAGAQPASGPDNPRVFLFFGDLTMSVVPEGEASQTLELSLAIGERRSIKAELVFPVEQTLSPRAPYDGVALGAGTACGLCHGAETRVTSIDFADAWASDVFQDEPEQRLSLSFVRQGALDCDHDATPGRCEMLDALFGHGEVEPGDLARDALICRPL